MKKFPLTFSFIILQITSFACGWGPYSGEDMAKLFLSNIGSTNDYYHFFYSLIRFNDLYYDANRYPQENLDEWNDYVGGNCKNQDIIKVIYKDDYEQTKWYKNILQEGYYRYYNNSFTTALLKKRNNDVFDYIIFAKKIEILLNSADPWNDNSFDESALNILINEGYKQIRNPNDIFLAQRYTYQIIVMLRYLHRDKEAIDLYNQTFRHLQGNKTSILKYWALSYVATCENRYYNKKISQLDFLSVLGNSSSKIYWAYRNLDNKYLDSIQSEFSTEQTYYFLISQIIHNPGYQINKLKKIAKINQNSILFNLLMIREVNKIEDGLLSKKYSTLQNPNDSTYRVNSAYAKKFTIFTESLLHNFNSENKSIYYLILSHLYAIQDNNYKAKYWLKLAKPLLKTDEELIQYHIESALINIAEENDEALFYNLNWLNLNESYNKKESKTWSFLIQAGFYHYHKSGNYTKAAIFFSFFDAPYDEITGTWNTFWSPFLYLDKFANEQQIKSFMAINEEVNKSNLYLLLTKYYKYDKNRFLDLLGTKNLRTGNLQTAYNYYKQVDSSFWRNSDYEYDIYLHKNPFEKFINDSLLCSYTIDYQYTNKAYFVKELINKKNNLTKTTGNTKARLAYEIGNAYFNMSYFGKSWYYDCYGKSVYGGSFEYTDFDTYVNSNYKTCSTAFKYYNIALSNVTDENLKKDILLSAQYAYKHVKYGVPDSWYYQPDTTTYINPYLVKMKQIMPTYYENFIKECKF